LADDVLRQSVQGITELITRPGVINVDFANVRNLMRLGGGALMSIGQGEGENKALKAIEQALHHPLLQDTSIDNAAGILVNFTCGEDLTLFDVDTALTYLRSQAGEKAEIILGVVNDERLENRVEAILVVTGLGARSIDEAIPGLNFSAPIRSNHPSSAQAQASENLVTTSVESVSSEEAYYASNRNNLDLPAFLRRPR
jgi:cell division protein FtsZ